MLNTINLEDNISVNAVFRMASEMVSEAFTKKADKLPSPCNFLKENNLKSFRSKMLNNGNMLLSVVTPEGNNYYAEQRNFPLAYIKLVRIFQSQSQKKIDYYGKH